MLAIILSSFVLNCCVFLSGRHNASWSHVARLSQIFCHKSATSSWAPAGVWVGKGKKFHPWIFERNVKAEKKTAKERKKYKSKAISIHAMKACRGALQS